jgi:hypothetical protein
MKKNFIGALRQLQIDGKKVGVICCICEKIFLLAFLYSFKYALQKIFLDLISVQRYLCYFIPLSYWKYITSIISFNDENINIIYEQFT